MSRLRVAVSAELLAAGGTPMSFDALEAHPGVELEVLPRAYDEIPASVAADYDALLLGSAKITAASVAGTPRLALVARLGVGYEHLDIGACTRAGVVVTITPDAVRRPTATAALALILATTQRLKARDELACSGRWRQAWGTEGLGLTGRTLGIVGLGNVGRELSRLARPLDMVQVASTRSQAAAGDVRIVPLEELLAVSDVVCLCCPLTLETRNLVDADALASMKPTAHLVNVGRGGLVDERALVAALEEGRIAGAALDVLADEPPDPGHPLLGMERVIVTAHALAHNDELLAGCARSACRAVAALADGREPDHAVDRAALGHARFAARRDAAA